MLSNINDIYVMVLMHIELNYYTIILQIPEKKLDFDMPHAKQRSRWLPPASHLRVTARRVRVVIALPDDLFAIVSSRRMRGCINSSSHLNVSLSMRNISRNCLSLMWSISPIANPRYLCLFLGFLLLYNLLANFRRIGLLDSFISFIIDKITEFLQTTDLWVIWHTVK